MKTWIITQARYGSTRFPGKVLKTIGEKTLLEIHLERLKRSRRAEGVLVATTREPEAESILEVASRCGVSGVRGSLEDVLNRYWQAAGTVRPDAVVRVTSDCPLVDAAVVDAMISRFEEGDLDYLANTQPPTFPDGVDVEIFSFAALERAWKEASHPKDREHVTRYFYTHPELFRTGNHVNRSDRSSVRLTVDYEEDFQVISSLIGKFGPAQAWEVYADALEQDQNLSELNRQRIRNEGF